MTEIPDRDDQIAELERAKHLSAKTLGAHERELSVLRDRHDRAIGEVQIEVAELRGKLSGLRRFTLRAIARLAVEAGVDGEDFVRKIEVETAGDG